MNSNIRLLIVHSLIAFTVFVTSLPLAIAVEKNPTAPSTSNSSDSKSFKISGMTCGGCENTVKSALEKLPEIATATADHKTGNVSIQFKSGQTVSDIKIKQTLTAAGYEIQDQK